MNNEPSRTGLSSTALRRIGIASLAMLLACAIGLSVVAVVHNGGVQPSPPGSWAISVLGALSVAALMWSTFAAERATARELEVDADEIRRIVTRVFRDRVSKVEISPEQLAAALRSVVPDHLVMPNEGMAALYGIALADGVIIAQLSSATSEARGSAEREDDDD